MNVAYSRYVHLGKEFWSQIKSECGLVSDESQIREMKCQNGISFPILPIFDNNKKWIKLSLYYYIIIINFYLEFINIEHNNNITCH